MSDDRNALEKAASSYLRSAMHQPVRWHEWGSAAFELAVSEDKPVLLDIGAVWCHWCHVMDRESYEDASLAQVINELFIPVKVDRDERPDVDARYQAAVSAISGQGGWPLTAVLTPQGKPFFGGTYFPREDRYGRPGFERVLRTMSDVWKSRRDEALESASSVMAAIEHGENFAGGSGQLSLDLADKLVEHAIGQFDPRNGGFGSQPKFPHPAALDLLMDAFARTGNEAARQAATVTLAKMAKGGVYDQIGGGFHRYSVDERWVVPHFEKMLYDNAELLKNYVHAFQTFVDVDFAAVAKDIMRWMNAELSDQERGGFYASQDADVTLDDDGDYFTWTKAEAAAVLTPDELAVAGVYYDIGELGDMHHDPKKNVLHVKHSLDEVASQIGKTPEQTSSLLAAAKSKLAAARLQRTPPFIDRTIYTGWNGLAIASYLEAAHVLGLEEPRQFALKTLDRVLADAWDNQAGLAHVVAYPDGQTVRERIAGVLDDYAFLANACVEAWQATGHLRYYQAAMDIADAMIVRFYDSTGGGFFDREAEPSGEQALGVLATRRKPLQDSPTPAGDPAAAAVLLRLEALSGRQDFRDKAEDTLEGFAGIVAHFGLYAGTYGLALGRLLRPQVQVIVIGEGESARALDATATAVFTVNKSIIPLRPEQVTPQNLPPSLAETLPQLPQLRHGASFAVVCTGNSCLPPTADAEEVLRQLASRD
jgi:uncharacterized protein YyaL (SSP411 family)